MALNESIIIEELHKQENGNQDKESSTFSFLRDEVTKLDSDCDTVPTLDRTDQHSKCSGDEEDSEDKMLATVQEVQSTVNKVKTDTSSKSPVQKDDQLIDYISSPRAPAISVSYKAAQPLTKEKGRSVMGKLANQKKGRSVMGKLANQNNGYEDENQDIVDVVQTVTKYRDRTASTCTTDSDSMMFMEGGMYNVEECVASIIPGQSRMFSENRNLHIERFRKEADKVDSPRGVRKKLASRKDKSAVSRRVVVPTYISQSDKAASSTVPSGGSGARENSGRSSSTVHGNRREEEVGHMVTMAASAAVAATQPYFKAQQDLEQQVAQLNHRLAELDRLSHYCADLNPTSLEDVTAAEHQLHALMAGDPGWGEPYPTPIPPHVGPHPTPLPPPHYCSRSMEEEKPTQAARKLDQVERLQKQQMAAQDRLLSLTKRINEQTKDTPSPQPTAHPVTLVDNSKSKKKKSSFFKDLMKAEDDERARNDDYTEDKSSFPIPSTNTQLLNDEIDNLRKDFKNQLNEIKRSIARPKKTLTESNHCNIHEEKQQSMIEKQAPLDKYLSFPGPLMHPIGPPPPPPEPHLPTVAHAMATAVPPDPFTDEINAERVLQEVTQRRCNLENNLEAIRRTKEGQVIYSLIDLLNGDENSAEKARIRAMVDDTIQELSKTIQAEVELEYARLRSKSPPRAPHTRMSTHAAVFKATSKPTGRPCRPQTRGKYGLVTPKVDSGLPQSKRPGHRQSPERVGGLRELSPLHYNRRTIKTPYLHFVNEVIPAKRPVPHIQDAIRQLKPIEIEEKRTTVQFSNHPASEEEEVVVDHPRLPQPRRGLVPLDIRQYSYSCHHPHELESTRMSEEGAGLKLPGYRTPPHRTGPQRDPLEIQLQNRLEDEVLARVLTDFARRRTVTQHRDPLDEVDTQALRELVEEVLANEIRVSLMQRPPPEPPLVQPPKPDVRTPSPSVQSERSYTEEFVSEDVSVERPAQVGRPARDTTYEEDERVYSSRHEIATPAPSSLPSDEEISQSPRHDPIPPPKTLYNTAAQTEPPTPPPATPRPPTPQHTPTPRAPSVVEHVTEVVEEEIVSLSDASDLTETLPDSWSEGLWLIDRSEGQAPDVPCEAKGRIKLGNYPPLPASSGDFDLTADLRTEYDRSEGEFIHPGGPSQLAPRDPVLNLLSSHYTHTHIIPAVGIGLRHPSHAAPPRFASAEYDELMKEMRNNRQSHPRRMRSPTGQQHKQVTSVTRQRNTVVKDRNMVDKERNTVVKERQSDRRQIRTSQSDGKSEGEVSASRRTYDFEENTMNSTMSMGINRPIQSSSPTATGGRLIQVQQSKESFTKDANELRTTGVSFGTHSELDTRASDRLSVDLGHYLAANTTTRDSQSETATGVLLTNQIIADALHQTGGTTFDLSYQDESENSVEGSPKYSPSRGYPATRLSVTVPSLEAVESDQTDSNVSH